MCYINACQVGISAIINITENYNNIKICSGSDTFNNKAVVSLFSTIMVVIKRAFYDTGATKDVILTVILKSLILIN